MSPFAPEYAVTLVIGLYDSLSRAQSAIDELIACGFSDEALSILVAGPPCRAAADADGMTAARARLLAAGPLAKQLRMRDGVDGEQIPHVLRAAGLTPFAASCVTNAIVGGAVMVAVQCEERRMLDARDILDACNEDEPLAPPPAAGRAIPDAVRHVNGKNRGT